MAGYTAGDLNWSEITLAEMTLITRRVSMKTRQWKIGLGVVVKS